MILRAPHNRPNTPSSVRKTQARQTRRYMLRHLPYPNVDTSKIYPIICWMASTTMPEETRLATSFVAGKS